MDHNQQTLLAGLSDNHEALFVTIVVRVGNRDRKSGSLKTQVASPNATPCFRSFADSFLRSHSKKASRAEQGPSGCLTVLGKAGRKCVANPGLTPISGAVCRNLAVCPQGLPNGTGCPFVVSPKRLSPHRGSPGPFRTCGVVQLQTMAKLAALLSMFLFAVGCGKSPSQKLTALSEEFVYSSLAFSPCTATATGLHQYQKQNLDEMLDDFSEQNRARQRTFYEKFRDRLADLNSAGLTPEDRADLTILQDQIAINLLDLTEIHSHQHSPQLYVETLGNALFAP